MNYYEDSDYYDPEEGYIHYICFGCRWYNGDDSEGECEMYPTIPYLRMFGRKKKCKHFKELNWRADLIDGLEYYLDDNGDFI